MVSEYKYGPMEPNTKGNGETIKLTERVNFGTLTAIFLRGIGRTIKRTAMVFTVIQMVQNMKETGKTIFKMALGLKNGFIYYFYKVQGQMVLDMKGTTHMGRRKVSGHTIGVMGLNT